MNATSPQPRPTCTARGDLNDLGTALVGLSDTNSSGRVTPPASNSAPISWLVQVHHLDPSQ